MGISVSAILTLAGAAATAINDFQQVAAVAAEGLSASDLAQVKAAQAGLQAQCSADFAASDAALAKAAGDPPPPAPGPA